MQKAVSRLVAGVNHLCRKKEGRAREESPGGKGTPLLKMEAIGDSWCRKKRMTALRLKDIRIQ